MRLVTLREIRAEKLSRSRTWYYLRIAEGKFPKPLSGAVPSLWIESEVDAAIEAFVQEFRRIPEDHGRNRVAKAMPAAKAARDRKRAAKLTGQTA